MYKRRCVLLFSLGFGLLMTILVIGFSGLSGEDGGLASVQAAAFGGEMGESSALIQRVPTDLDPTLEPRTCWVRLNDDLTDYASIQAAVDASQDPDDLVKVAGTCVGVEQRPAPNGYDGATIVSQTLFISKTVTVRGGYTVSNWIEPDFLSYPTVLSAKGDGRGLFIAGNASPKIDSLAIIRGDASGLGGWSDASSELDAGGGIFVLTATAKIIDCIFYLNTADDGGGVFLYNSSSLLQGNTFANNFSQFGGGLTLWNSDASIDGNTFTGGVALNGGGGIFVSRSDPVLENNRIIDNWAGEYGGGIALWKSGATFINTAILDNRADWGSGIHVTGSTPHLFHTTIARNEGKSGIEVWKGGEGTQSKVELENTILVSHTSALSIAIDSEVIVDGVLWYSNTVNTQGAGSISTKHELFDPPDFLPDGYHLSLSSAAIDAGIPLALDVDIEGDTRPMGALPDLGADEMGDWFGPDRAVELVPSTPLIFTHTLTNMALDVQRFSLDALVSGGFQATVVPTHTDLLNAFESTLVRVTLQTPSDALSGTLANIAVKAAGDLIGMEQIEHRATVVFDAQDPSLGWGKMEKVLPGKEIAYTHTLTNRANAPQRFVLEAASSEKYTTTVEPTQTGFLDPFNGTVVISVTLEIPVDAEPGTVDLTLVSATGELGGSISVVDTTRIDSEERTVFLPICTRMQ